MSTPVVLAQHLAAELPVRFSWASNNCCHFAARWVLRSTGRDVLLGLPATPDARAALRLLRALGGGLRAAWTQQLGRPPVPPELAEVGDLVLFAAGVAGPVPGTGELVGVCCGDHAACLGKDGNILFLPLAQAECAWPLGDAA